MHANQTDWNQPKADDDLRKSMIKRILEMNKSFNQRQKTIHLAICYLDKMLEQSDLFTRKFNDA